MEIRCPKNGYVKRIIKASGDPVGINDDLVTIESVDEQLALDRLASGHQMADISGRMLSPDFVAKQRRMVQINIDIASKYEEYARVKCDFTRQLEGLGLNNTEMISLKQAEAAHEKCTGELEKARLALEVFELNIQTAQERQALLMAQLEIEKLYLRGKLDSLTIKAPVSGTLKLTIATNSFCSRGDVIGNIS